QQASCLTEAPILFAHSPQYVGVRTPSGPAEPHRNTTTWGRCLESFWDLAEIDLRERGANELGLVGLGVAAPLQLGDHRFQVLDVFVVERDAYHFVVRGLLGLAGGRLGLGRADGR